MKSKYKLVDFKEKYGSIMKFGQNKNEYIHRWYPFVEGYSREFILKILEEYREINNTSPRFCLEPFAGSGTTPLELQRLGIECYSFEVSPFMYELSCTKMVTSYTVKTFKIYLKQISEYIANCDKEYTEEQLYKEFKTIVEKEGLDKWNFNREVIFGILDIINSISMFRSRKYKSLFTVALASILLEVSNVYRNGKCFSYKDDWKNKVQYTRNDVHRIYVSRLNGVFLEDIAIMEKERRKHETKSNYKNCFLGDSRRLLYEKLEDNKIDLVITSPPYLNSRDYTDTYMIELRVLGFLRTHDDVRNLRNNTIRSHVQVKWGDTEKLKIPILVKAINQISKCEDEFWSSELLNMIKGYFLDMNVLFRGFSQKLRKGGLIFFNVANSAYYNVEIKVDEIICQIAENNGFEIMEIREARRVKPSSQQKDKISSLRESVIVMSKK